MTKQDYKASMTLTRQAARIALGLPPNTSATFPALAALHEQIAEETAPEIAKSREFDDFIASGKSLIAWIKEKTTPAHLPAWARLTPPTLPVGLPMPPNKVLNPRIILPAINV